MNTLSIRHRLIALFPLGMLISTGFQESPRISELAGRMRPKEFFDYGTRFIEDVNGITLKITDQVTRELDERQTNAHASMVMQIALVLALSTLVWMVKASSRQSAA